jgi:hypothetical protein
LFCLLKVIDFFFLEVLLVRVDKSILRGASKMVSSEPFPRQLWRCRASAACAQRDVGVILCPCTALLLESCGAEVGAGVNQLAQA